MIQLAGFYKQGSHKVLGHFWGVGGFGFRVLGFGFLRPEGDYRHGRQPETQHPEPEIPALSCG
jgi:hypothetical protein